MIPNIAIIGLGHIGLLHEFDEKRVHPCTHVGVWSALQKTGQANIVAVVDKDLDRRNDFPIYAMKNNRNLCNVPVCSNITELETIERTIDIAIIATPTFEHYSNVKLLCEYATPKIIFIEKPIAECLSDANLMIELCQKNGITLSINHTRRWSAVYNSEAIHEFLKKIKPQQVTFNYPGPILRDGTHAFDVLRMWFGDPTVIKTFKCRTENWMTTKNVEFTDFNYSGLIEFPTSQPDEPLIVYYNGASNTSYLLFEVDVIGKDGRLTIKDNGATIQTSLSSESKRYTGLRELVATEVQCPSDYNPLLLAAENMIEVYATNIEPKCTGNDGYLALEMAIAFQNSWQNSSEALLPLTDDSYTKKIHSW